MEEKNLNALHLNKLHPGHNFKSKEVDDYRLISDWSYAAILSTCCLENFRGDVEDVIDRLKSKMSAEEVRAKVKRLLDLKLLEETLEEGLRPSQQKTFSRDDVPNEGVREYHRQTSKLAIQAIENDAIETREFQSYAISLDSKKVPLLKDMIRRFILEIERETMHDHSDHVYQINLQFFQLTNGPSSRQKEAKTIAN